MRNNWINVLRTDGSARLPIGWATILEDLKTKEE